MFLNPHLSDVVILAKKRKVTNTNEEEWERFPAHRSILADRCEFFEKMFCTATPFKEANSSEVKIDEDAEIVRIALRYIYCNVAELSELGMKQLLRLMNISTMWLLDGLKEKCSQELNRRLTIDNVCALATAAVDFNEPELLAKCVQKLAMEAPGAYTSLEGFTELPAEVILSLVRCNQTTHNEADLFRAVVCWGERRLVAGELIPVDTSTSSEPHFQVGNPRLRRLLDPFLRHIRFPLMTGREIAHIVEPTQLLANDELFQIYRHIANGRSTSLFPTAPRSTATVLVISSPKFADETPNVIETLRLGGVTGFVTFDARTDLPSLEVMRRHAVAFTFSSAPYVDASELGDILADYNDLGGAVVTATFATNSDAVGLRGRYVSEGYMALSQGRQADESHLTMQEPSGSVRTSASASESPTDKANANNYNGIHNATARCTQLILEGVRAFDGGPKSYRSLCRVQPGATLVARWSDGTPLIAIKQNGAGINITLNFFPASSRWSTDCWDASTDGHIIIRNAIAFAAANSKVADTHFLEE